MTKVHPPKKSPESLPSRVIADIARNRGSSPVASLLRGQGGVGCPGLAAFCGGQMAAIPGDEGDSGDLVHYPYFAAC